MEIEHDIGNLQRYKALQVPLTENFEELGTGGRVIIKPVL
jgi:hypothetical protein